MTKLLDEIRDFQKVTGLSDHRTGIVLARNGRLVERLEKGKRFWPETVKKIRGNICAELARRSPQVTEGPTQ